MAKATPALAGRASSPLMRPPCTFQPHPDLYEELATNVFKHYSYYKKDQIDKAYIPSYLYLGGAGTGKSRHGSEFASSIQEAINLRIQDPLYHELAQRLKKAYVFHVSFENGTSLMNKEKSDPWNAVGVRMLKQLLNEPIEYISKRYLADPRTIFRLVAAAENVDLYNDFTGILVVDGMQAALTGNNDGQDKNSPFYGLLTEIASLSLMSRDPSGTKGKPGRTAPFIMTCVTATCVGPIDRFFADTYRMRVYLPLNRLHAPAWKASNELVIKDSPFTRLLMKDVGGHARVIELIADELNVSLEGREPDITEIANTLYKELNVRYSKAMFVLRNHVLSIVHCILSRQQISLGQKIPGSDVLWENVTSPGLIWFERDPKNNDYDAPGYLVVPYIWFWMLARQPMPESANADRLCKFLDRWQFNDYAHLHFLQTGEGEGLSGTTCWEGFEKFCCSFRILRSLGFGDGEEVPLKVLHSGCKLRDDEGTMVVNRHLDFAKARRRCRTSSTTRKHAATSEAGSADGVDIVGKGILDAHDQLSRIVLNAAGAPAGDFFLRIEIPTQRSLNKKSGRDEDVNEVGQCKWTEKKLTKATYTRERKKAAADVDIFILYTQAETLGDWDLPDRSGIVDASCWESYFGPFAGRAYMAWEKSNLEDEKGN
jgi:hypothetical protein